MIEAERDGVGLNGDGPPATVDLNEPYAGWEPEGIVWQGPFKEVATRVNRFDYRIWAGTAAALSARAGRLLCVGYEGTHLYANSAYLLLGNTGTGKSLCTGTCRALLPDDHHTVGGFESGQALVEGLAEIQYVTENKIRKIAKVRTRPVCLVAEEFTQILKAATYLNSTFTERFNFVMDGGHRIDVARAREEAIYVRDPELTCLATSVATEFVSRLAGQFVDLGFFNRWHLLPTPPDDFVYLRMDPAEHIGSTGNLRDYALSLTMSPWGGGRDRRELYEPAALEYDLKFGNPFFAALRTGPDLLRKLSARLHMHHFRTMCLYACFQGHERIKVLDVMAAEAITKASYQFMQHLVAGRPIEKTAWQRGEEQLAERILAYVRQRGRVSKRAVVKALHRVASPRMIRESLEELINAEQLTTNTNAKGGRGQKSEVWLQGEYDD